MLAHETNFDDHLDALEDRSGHVFSLSRKHVKKKSLLEFETEVVKASICLSCLQLYTLGVDVLYYLFPRN